MNGIDWEGPPVIEPNNTEIVEIPESRVHLTCRQTQEHIDPCQPSDDFGVSIYVAACAFITACLS